METLVLTVDLAALLMLLFYSLRNEKRPPGTAEEGPFAIKLDVLPRETAPPPRRAVETYRRAKSER